MALNTGPTLLPRRLGLEAARAIMHNRQPLTAQQALQMGFTDDCLPGDVPAFRAEVARYASKLAAAARSTSADSYQERSNERATKRPNRWPPTATRR